MNTKKPAPQKLNQQDWLIICITGVLGCITAGIGAFIGNMLVMAAGILLTPIALVIRFPRFPK
jgi:hypothetical protein